MGIIVEHPATSVTSSGVNGTQPGSGGWCHDKSPVASSAGLLSRSAVNVAAAYGQSFRQKVLKNRPIGAERIHDGLCDPPPDPT
jgi:hypothetical protein